MSNVSVQCNLGSSYLDMYPLKIKKKKTQLLFSRFEIFVYNRLKTADQSQKSRSSSK